jgi:uncharacterized protein DUF6803
MATTLRPRTNGTHAAAAPQLLPGLAIAVVAALVAVAAAVVLPDITAAGRMTTTPTHYMGLLMANQPWNLLLFMALPFAVIYLGLLPAALGLFPSRLGRVAVAFLAVYLTVVSVYLVRWAVVPLTDGNGWRGPVDLIAVGGYVLTAVPILVLAGLTFSGGSAKAQTWWAWAALVVAHVAMTFGMMAPFVLGWADATSAAHAM